MLLSTLGMLKNTAKWQLLYPMGHQNIDKRHVIIAGQTNRNSEHGCVKLSVFHPSRESLYEKRGSGERTPMIRTVTCRSRTDVIGWKRGRGRFDRGGVVSPVWHNYNNFELVVRGKFVILPNNALFNNPTSTALHAPHGIGCIKYFLK